MSPGLSPIELVWDVIRRSIADQRLAPMTIDVLKSTLVPAWVWLSQELIRTLVNGMKRRCESCASVRGNHTPY
ncbi:hypothetical protein TNCV_2014731 [Trichonephila clavipes]|nr:hypothetical protein TNCV_2014731 [Trichonephila clavipes]